MSRTRAGRNLFFFRLGWIFPVLLLLLSPLRASPVASAPAAQGTGAPQSLKFGDILVSVASRDILHYDSAGNYLGRLVSNSKIEPAGLVFNPFDQLLYVTSLSGAPIHLFNSDGASLGTLDASGFDGPFSIVFNDDQQLYVGLVGASAIILEIHEGDTIVQQFNVPVERVSSRLSGSSIGAFIDLSVDQRTMFYTTGGRLIQRYDVAGGGPMPPFVDLSRFDGSDDVGPTYYAANFRLLHPGDGSGGLIIADYANIKRIDGKGDLFNIYDYFDGSFREDTWYALSLDPDGKSFWATSGSRAYKFDIASGTILDDFDAGEHASSLQLSTITGITIVGEPAAAQPTDTPTPTRTRTLTPTVTRTFTPSPTGSYTPPPTDLPTDTPTEPPPPDTPTEYVAPPPYPRTETPQFPWVPIVTVIVVAATLGATYLVMRAVKPAPRPGYRQSAVRFRVQEGTGEQTIEAASNAQTPQIQFSLKEGPTDIFIEEG